MSSLPPRLRLAVLLGLSAHTRPAILCEVADVERDVVADDLDGPLDAAIEARDFGPLAAALSRIFGE